MRRHSAHVDVNVLAELNAGLIDGQRATRIHAHLAGCQHCAQVSAGLTEVRALLAAVPPPVIPDTVAHRLGAAIAAEAAARSGAAAGSRAHADGSRAAAGSPVDPADSGIQPAGSGIQRAAQRPFPRAGHGRGGSARALRHRLTSPVAVRALTAAAAVCAVAVGGYTAAQLTSPGRPGPVASPRTAGGAHEAGPVAGPFIAPTHSGNAVRPGSGQPAFEVVSSGIDYQHATLGGQVSSELTKAGDAGASSATGKRLLRAATAQQHGCVLRVTSGVRPAMVDAARYQGHPATVIALSQRKPQLAQAWVVGPRCSADVSDVLAHVWLHPSGG